MAALLTTSPSDSVLPSNSPLLLTLALVSNSVSACRAKTNVPSEFCVFTVKSESHPSVYQFAS